VWKLIDALDDSCDVVFAEYTNKRHAAWRNLGSRVNDYMAVSLIGKPKNLKISSFCACKGYVADTIRKYDGGYSYLSGLLLRSAKRIKNVPIEHKEREIGRSGYTMRKLLSLWMNGFTAFSVKPLRVATIIGFIAAACGFFYGFYVLLQRFVFRSYVLMGWSSTMAALLFIGGMIMIMLGLIGEYIGRIYMGINKSPQFVVREYVCSGENAKHEKK
jgi:undecaprenyl-phosphate 4-deoxy-4-formamido-L-arabinose transferase